MIEASTWTMEHLRGARLIAAQDAAARERLDRQLRQGRGDSGDDGSVTVTICECGEACRPHTLTGICDRCCKRNWMRKARQRSKQARENANTRWHPETP